MPAWSFRAVLVLITVIALSATGCGGGSSEPKKKAVDPLVIPTPTSTVTVSATAAPWSVEAASRQYRAFLTPVDEAILAFSALPEGTTDEDAVEVVATLAAASATAAERLRTAPWPFAARPAVNTLIATLLQQQDLFAGLADSGTLAAMRKRADAVAQTLLVLRTFASGVESELGIVNPLSSLSPSSGRTNG